MKYINDGRFFFCSKIIPFLLKSVNTAHNIDSSQCQKSHLLVSTSAVVQSLECLRVRAGERESNSQSGGSSGEHDKILVHYPDQGQEMSAGQTVTFCFHWCFLLLTYQLSSLSTGWYWHSGTWFWSFGSKTNLLACVQGAAVLSNLSLLQYQSSYLVPGSDRRQDAAPAAVQ